MCMLKLLLGESGKRMLGMQKFNEQIEQDHPGLKRQAKPFFILQ